MNMITLEEINKCLQYHTAISSKRVMLKTHPFHKGIVFKIEDVSDELFISDKESDIFYHSALSILIGNHPYRYRCMYVDDSDYKVIYTGIKV